MQECHTETKNGGGKSISSKYCSILNGIQEELREQYEGQVDSQIVQDILNQGDDQALETEIKLEPLSPEKELLLFEKIDLMGISQWEPAEQE